MRSKASIAGHPLHPILIAFPTAFITGGLGFDLAGYFLRSASLSTTGAYLSIAGIITGLVAAIPGIVDWFAIVPPNSAAKTAATTHMVVNFAALGLYAAGWFFRTGPELSPGIPTLALELVSAGLLMFGGWLGGELVYRYLIAVDQKQVGASEWKEVSIDAKPGETVTVAKISDLKVDQTRLLHVAGKRIALGRTEKGFFAFDDRCTHKGGPLSDGVLICGTIRCPWHGAQFDVETGHVKDGPAKDPIRTYEVEVVGGEVRLKVPADLAASAA